MPPIPRPVPAFIASASQEGIPYGRWAERLSEQFQSACEAIGDLPAGAAAAEVITWYPERRWGERTWVPATALADTEAGVIEYYGHVSYLQGEGGEQNAFAARADFTDVLADQNPGWRIDLNDDVIGRWQGESGMAGDVTLVWGKPLVRGGVAVSAELADKTVDQEPLREQRFTLVALDALVGFGDDVFMEVKLWTKGGQELASESLYGDSDDAEEEPAEEQAG
jgi:hypothetical protein